MENDLDVNTTKDNSEKPSAAAPSSPSPTASPSSPPADAGPIEKSAPAEMAHEGEVEWARPTDVSSEERGDERDQPSPDEIIEQEADLGPPLEDEVMPEDTLSPEMSPENGVVGEAPSIPADEAGPGPSDIPEALPGGPSSVASSPRRPEGDGSRERVDGNRRRQEGHHGGSHQQSGRFSKDSSRGGRRSDHRPGSPRREGEGGGRPSSGGHGGGGRRWRERGSSQIEVRRPASDKNNKNEILANCSTEETRVAVMEHNRLIELLIERSESEKIVGNIYKGRVENVLPGISSAFVDIGLEKNAYLYVSDVIPTKSHNPSSQIEKMISRNEIIMVQVAKEAIGTKGVKVTMDLSLPGRFLVYMPFSQHVGVSKNIEDRKERDRLRSIVDSCAPEKGGVIIRTEAEGAEEDALRREMQYLMRLWDSTQRRFESAATPALIHRDLGLVFQTVRDLFTENTNIFLVDSRREYRDLLDFLDSISPELKSRVKLYEGKTPLFQAYNIEPQIEKACSARVDLPSGGYIIIQEAEGLCAIDVNTGKFTGKRSQEETVTLTNVEAAQEVARQLRLRNIGGIIVIDFIDMRHAKNRQKVMETLADYVRNDRAKIKILPITRLGLVEMTRERKRESLFALLGEPCDQCHASGLVLSRDSLFIKIKREILALTHGRPGELIKVFLCPTVAQYFQERRQRLEQAIKHRLSIHADPNLPWEEYRILIE